MEDTEGLIRGGPKSQCRGLSERSRSFQRQAQAIGDNYRKGFLIVHLVKSLHDWVWENINKLLPFIFYSLQISTKKFIEYEINAV